MIYFVIFFYDNFVAPWEDWIVLRMIAAALWTWELANSRTRGRRRPPGARPAPASSSFRFLGLPGHSLLSFKFSSATATAAPVEARCARNVNFAQKNWHLFFLLSLSTWKSEIMLIMFSGFVRDVVSSANDARRVLLLEFAALTCRVHGRVRVTQSCVYAT